MSVADDGFRAIVPDYVDRELGEDDARRLERHLEHCAECTQLADDLRRIDHRAAALSPVEPPPELWRHIGEAIDSRRAHSRRGQWVISLSLAATIVAMVGAGLLYRYNRPSAPSNAELMGQVAQDLAEAERHYQSAIDGLEEIFQENRESLDPELSSMLQENLEVIEAAVVESRKALASEPQSQIARDSLLDGLRLKVTLLQNAILMMNEVRKGDGEGAVGFIEKMRSTEPRNSI